MPQIGYWTPNGAPFDPRTMHCTERKFRGLGAEVAIHLPTLIRQQPPRIDFHLLDGTRNPDAMEFDAPVWARLAARHNAPELTNLVNEEERMGALWTLHECCPNSTLGFYQGRPEHSEVFMNNGWLVDKLSAVDQRVDSSIRTFLRLRDRMERYNIGRGRVALWMDMLCACDKDSLSAYVHDRLHRHHGIPTGGETRPHKVAAWANRPDIPWVTQGWFWHHLENDPVAIPSNDLKGPQWLIYDASDIEGANRSLGIGLNVSFIGEWTQAQQASPEPTLEPRFQTPDASSPCTA